jgi:NADP-dependent 3-hydroxy acid dehydrogenase YdfG
MIVITGANSAIGKAISTALAEQNLYVVLTSMYSQ